MRYSLKHLLLILSFVGACFALTYSPIFLVLGLALYSLLVAFIAFDRVVLCGFRDWPSLVVFALAAISLLVVVLLVCFGTVIE